MTTTEEPLAYALDSEDMVKLQAVCLRLNSPRHLTYENRCDMSDLINLICKRSVPINSP